MQLEKDSTNPDQDEYEASPQLSALRRDSQEVRPGKTLCDLVAYRDKTPVDSECSPDLRSSIICTHTSAVSSAAGLELNTSIGIARLRKAQKDHATRAAIISVCFLLH